MVAVISAGHAPHEGRSAVSISPERSATPIPSITTSTSPERREGGEGLRHLREDPRICSPEKRFTGAIASCVPGCTATGRPPAVASQEASITSAIRITNRVIGSGSRLPTRSNDVPSFDGYPFCLPVVRGMEELTFRSPVTFLVGENGSGKSTLLEAIAAAWGFNPEGGSRNFRFATRPSHSALEDYLRLVRNPGRPADGFFLRAESFYNVATEVDRLGMESAYGGASLHAQSHGESFLAVFMDRLFGGGLYLMDEPEAALSPSRQLSVLLRMHDLVRQRSQFVVATHSPILMGYPGADILLLDEDGFRRVEYEETEHYVITREFLNARERILAELLS
jgi:predicted ATPase